MSDRDDAWRPLSPNILDHGRHERGSNAVRDKAKVLHSSDSTHNLHPSGLAVPKMMMVEPKAVEGRGADLWNSELTLTESKTIEGRDSSSWNSEGPMVESKELEGRDSNLWDSELTLAASVAQGGRNLLSANSLGNVNESRLNMSRDVNRILAASMILEESESLSNKSIDHEQRIDGLIERQRIPDNGEHGLWGSCFDASMTSR